MSTMLLRDCLISKLLIAFFDRNLIRIIMTKEDEKLKIGPHNFSNKLLKPN